MAATWKRWSRSKPCSSKMAASTASRSTVATHHLNAVVRLKDGEKVEAVAISDGPIDTAYKAIDTHQNPHISRRLRSSRSPGAAPW